MRLVIHNGSPVWGGNEKWVSLVAAGLRDRGHEVVVSCPQAGVVERRLEGLGVRTVAVRPRGDLDLFNAVRFARWLRRQAPDAILCASWSRIPTLAAAARWAGVPRVVVRLGIVRALRPRSRYGWTFRHGVNAMIVNSTEIREHWLRSAPWFPAGAVHVVHNAVSPVPRLSAQDRERIRAEIGIGADSPLVVGIGHVYRRKGFDLLVEAFAAANVPGSHLAIVGTGLEVDALKALAQRLGVGERVHWPGFRSDPDRVLAASDLFVLSSRNEGMANVLLEAMSAGTPVVATDISGVAYAIGAGPEGREAGWIVPPEDPGALAAALSEVLTLQREHPEAVATRVEEARRRVRERFGVERMIDEVERVLIGSDGPPGSTSSTDPTR